MSPPPNSTASAEKSTPTADASPEGARAGAGGFLSRIGTALSLLAGLPGLYYGYGFGDHFGGPILGVIAALSCAAFCVLMISGAIDALAAMLSARR